MKELTSSHTMLELKGNICIICPNSPVLEMKKLRPRGHRADCRRLAHHQGSASILRAAAHHGATPGMPFSRGKALPGSLGSEVSSLEALFKRKSILIWKYNQTQDSANMLLQLLRESWKGPVHMNGAPLALPFISLNTSLIVFKLVSEWQRK